MATPYTKVFDVFMRKVSDYTFLKLTQAQIDGILKGYLASACVRFKHCRVSLTDRDETLLQFGTDLSDEESEIIGTLMIVEWLSPQIHNTLLLKQHMSDKDFKIFSQANHLAELIALRNTTAEEANDLMIAYNYDDIFELEKLR